MADLFRKHLDKCGIGGVHCNCCNAYFGKDKPALSRLTRRRLKTKTRKLIHEELID